MASAWEQLGEIQRINQLRRQAQLGRAVNAVYHTKHFARFSEETLLKVASTAQSRLVVTETVDNVSTTHDAGAADFAIGPSRPGRLRATAPLDEPGQRHQQAFPHRRRAAHEHGDDVERHESSSACRKRKPAW